jgi:hypothetical protein
MHISTSKIAFSPEEIFNYLEIKDPLMYQKVCDLICNYADELYQNYPGSRLAVSPVSKGMQIKSCGVPIFFEVGFPEVLQVNESNFNSFNKSTNSIR